jgi:hypothetical protein
LQATCIDCCNNQISSSQRSMLLVALVPAPSDEARDDSLLAAQEDYRDTRFLWAKQVWCDLGWWAAQDRLAVDLAQDVALLDHS